jgi:hypothetical protein
MKNKKQSEGDDDMNYLLSERKASPLMFLFWILYMVLLILIVYGDHLGIASLYHDYDSSSDLHLKLNSNPGFLAVTINTPLEDDITENSIISMSATDIFIQQEKGTFIIEINIDDRMISLPGGNNISFTGTSKVIMMIYTLNLVFT